MKVVDLGEAEVETVVLLVLYGIAFGGWWLAVSRRIRGQEAARLAEHEAQLQELARQRELRELEEHRRALMRGRERACEFCGIEDGALTPADVCTDVEACLARAGKAPVGLRPN